MNPVSKINKKTRKLQNKYKLLVEDAYNFRETDSNLSDTYAYDAMKLLNELNRLKYFSRDFTQSLS
ncbi:hypothetical protein SAMN03097699_3380 [Flavobacteriaceae bacterium MAR_2010_188]|nr:hypothetical protein SAMN03097699_3380 [Flavobacteriaceae bacterium MAR_2010_188]